MFSSAGVLAIHVYCGSRLADADRFSTAINRVYVQGGLDYDRNFPDFWDSPDNGPQPVDVHGFLFYHMARPGAAPSDVWHLMVPHWAGAAAFGVLPALGLFRMTKRRRQGASRTGHCPVCGYDLRATPGRCPECGAVPAGAAAR